MGTLVNLGNTCGINSLIQCISHTSDLRNFIIESTTIDSASITYQLKDVISKIYNNNVTLSPNGLLQALYLHFKDTIYEHQQTDIGELWELIANKIADENSIHVNEEIFNNDIEKLPKLQAKVENDVRKINNNKFSIWLHRIQGIQLSIIKCMNQSCDELNYTPEVFISIQISITDIHSNLSDNILHYFNIDTMNEWKCEKCKNIGALKQYQIWKLPSVLVIHIKRFHIDSDFKITKLNTPLTISEDLNFSFTNYENIKYDVKYKLCALGNHYGICEGGHYNAICKNNNSWFVIDDTHKHELSQDENENFLKNNTDAYILFYQKI